MKTQVKLALTMMLVAFLCVNFYAVINHDAKALYVSGVIICGYYYAKWRLATKKG